MRVARRPKSWAGKVLETIVGRKILSAQAPCLNHLRETAVALAKRYQINSPVRPVQQGPRSVRLANDSDFGTTSPAVALQWLANAEFSRQRWSTRKTLAFALGSSVLLWAAIGVLGFMFAKLIA